MEQDSILSKTTLPAGLPKSIDRRRYMRFLERVGSENSLQHAAITFACSCRDPLQWLFMNPQKNNVAFYWEKPDASQALAATGSAASSSAKGSRRFAAIQEWMDYTRQRTAHLCLWNDTDTARPPGFHFVGGFSFFDDIEQSAWDGFEPASLTLPEYTMHHKNGQTLATIVVRLQPGLGAGELYRAFTGRMQQVQQQIEQAGHASPLREQSGPVHPISDTGRVNDYKRWASSIRDIRSKIQKRHFGKVVLGRQLTLELAPSHSPFAALHRLRSSYPQCTTFLYRPGSSGTFIGSSPEVLLAVDGNRIKTEAIAGSMARGNTDPKDHELASELQESLKNRKEHTFVLNDIRRLLTPFTKELESSETPIIKKLANVQHLYSPIKAKMKEQTEPLSLLGHLHPTPAVGGTPREPALRYIRKHEPFERGLFAGPIGWINSRQQAEFTVAIRSGLLTGGTARLFAGCGIVADSDPETEWQETNLKFMPMLSALNYD